MKYHEMTKNYIFREFECGLSIEQTAELCFKTVSTVKKWDGGSMIPPECKRLMRMHKRLELSYCTKWDGFVMRNSVLELPTGQMVSPQEIILGIALISIQSELELRTISKISKHVRAISRINRSS